MPGAKYTRKGGYTRFQYGESCKVKEYYDVESEVSNEAFGDCAFFLAMNVMDLNCEQVINCNNIHQIGANEERHFGCDLLFLNPLDGYLMPTALTSILLLSAVLPVHQMADLLTYHTI